MGCANLVNHVIQCRHVNGARYIVEDVRASPSIYKAVECGQIIAGPPSPPPTPTPTKLRRSNVAEAPLRSITKWLDKKLPPLLPLSPYVPEEWNVKREQIPVSKVTIPQWVKDMVVKDPIALRKRVKRKRDKDCVDRDRPVFTWRAAQAFTLHWIGRSDHTRRPIHPVASPRYQNTGTITYPRPT